MPADKPTPEPSIQEQDDFLQEALEETFPASDPIAPGRPTHKEQGAASREVRAVSDERG